MSSMTRAGYGGTGAGAITPDGCAVEVYARLPVGAEPDVVAGAAPAGARILELGCGVGRVTHPLVERGFEVTAVDESPEMLERVRGARTVCSAIEDLDLGERFDVVLLGSFLVHAGDTRVRDGLLRSCRRHVADGGHVLVQREGDGWHDQDPPDREIPGGRVRVVSSTPVGDGVRSVRVDYDFADGSWSHTFVSRPLTRTAFEQALAAAGLTVESYLTDDGTWALARAATAG